MAVLVKFLNIACLKYSLKTPNTHIDNSCCNCIYSTAGELRLSEIRKTNYQASCDTNLFQTIKNKHFEHILTSEEIFATMK